MFKDDLIRLRHRLDAAKEAGSFVADRTRVDLDQDRMLVPAPVKAMEIISEAATRITEETQMKYPEVL